MKYLYKYPQAAYPYGNLVETNRRRGKQDFEYELLDTGVFDQDRYFDVFVEYAKASPEDILIQITVDNRGPEPATLHVLPTLWFRNVWSWGGDAARPVLRQAAGEAGGVIAASHPDLGERFLYAEGAAALLFTENETNNERLFGSPNRTPYVKDGINNYIVHGRRDAVNPEKTGTKAAAHYPLTVAAGESRTLRLRLSDVAPARIGSDEGRPVRQRLRRRDAGAPAGGGRVLRHGHPVLAERRRGQRDAPGAGRHALVQAVLLLRRRHSGSRSAAPIRSRPKRRAAPRNDHWHHMYNADIISMPDKWEYPWYAAWDLAFHVLALTLVDEDFGKQQLDLMLGRALPAPERAAPRLRVELRRRQPAGARLVHHLHVPPGEGAARPGRPRLARAHLPEAAAELHLVGEPQGPLRQQRLRGRLPGAGQHRRLRPQRAAADRRVPGAGRRHRLDGALLPEHARDRRGAGARTTRLCGHGAQVRRAFPVDRLVDDPRRRGHRDVGRGGRVLLRRAPAAGRPGPAAEGALHGRPAPPVRGHRLRRAAHGKVSGARRTLPAGSSRRARS